jgi:hypothetical protein
MLPFAVALATVAFIACTNADPGAPRALPTDPDDAPSASEAKGKGSSETAEEDLQETTEGTLPGLPQQTNTASGPAPSKSPLCGTSLTCSGTSVGGSKACRESESSIGDVFCCPNVGDRIVDGACVAKICGTGLTCSGSPTSGASACRQTASSTNDVFCCPISGWRIQNGQCIPPVCGTGLTCAAVATTGASVCRQTSTSTNDVFCCPTPGAKIIDGKCQ